MSTYFSAIYKQAVYNQQQQYVQTTQTTLTRPYLQTYLSAIYKYPIKVVEKPHYENGDLTLQGLS